MKKLALAGNPNCGKTTLFNALTGSNQYVGNWPGVTVEKKEGKLKSDHDLILVDLPGIYSLSPYSMDEVIARDYLIDDQPNLIINLVDATNLERNLYLTTQLQESGIPIVVVLNMMDLVKASHDRIDTKKLEQYLHCPVVEVSALKNEGLDQLLIQIKQRLAQSSHETVSIFQKNTEAALSQIKEYLKAEYPAHQQRWYAVKYFENDEKIVANSKLDKSLMDEIAKIRTQLEEQANDDGESIITNERYAFIDKVIQDIYHKSRTGLSTSDRIDQIVTNRWLALPIFAAIMTFVYAMAVNGIGGFATDWVNDVLFTEIIPVGVENFLTAVNCADWLSSLILDGIIAGVGAVLGFVPQMLVLFFFLAILEDIGYMARIAFILDRVFRKFGLSGKSFIPMLVATGCGVPGIMASRTIENENDRRMTIMTTTFIPCSAKLPIIALIAGALFHDAWWVSPIAYFIGIAAVILSGIILKKTRRFAGDITPFVMELPAYHMPKASNILHSMWERGFSFIKKAGTIILLSTIVIWFLSNFGFVGGSLIMLEPEAMNESLLASLGSALAPLFAPLGWGHWEAAVAAISGLVAKENVVSTLGILHGLGEVAEDGVEIWGAMAVNFTSAAAFSFLVFNLLCAPCFAAIGAIKREMNNQKWTIFAIAYQCGLAYVVSLIIYQVWNFFQTREVTIGFIVALLVFIAMVYLLLRKPYRETLKGQPVPCRP